MKKYGLLITSIVFLAVLTAWPVLAALTIPAGTPVEQLEAVCVNLVPHIINFSVALLIGPSLLAALFFFYRSLSLEAHRVFEFAGIVLFGVYLILITISYGSQVFYFPLLAPSSPVENLMSWFFYNDASLPIMINQTAYFFWSLATLILFGRAFKKGALVKVITGLLYLSSLLQILASAGMFFGIGALTTLSFISGLILLPMGIVLVVYSARKLRGQP